MLNNIKILWHQGKQYIPDVTKAKVPGIFKGRPVISRALVDYKRVVEICPLGAINIQSGTEVALPGTDEKLIDAVTGDSLHPVMGASLTMDLGKCNFCGECAAQFPEKISFTTDYKLATNERSRLIIYEGINEPVTLNAEKIRKEITALFKSSLKLRQVSAAGDNSTEWELNAANNVQFDMSRYGIEFVASPRHADGIVITGPISENMSKPLQICYDAIPDPKIIILAGTDAISGGIFNDSRAVDRSFLDKYPIDLFIPGNPVHPLTFINGVVDFLRKKD